MSDIAIKAENVGKLYRLGQIGTGTLSHDLNRWWAQVRGKEDPFAKIGEANDRTKKGESDYVWALQDVDFEIKKGDAVGIIGRNGAGKSTLLKLLSKVTKPTTGSIKIDGRIASLLEVGTGFHPEMTGRENIYLNGAILGMRKREIDRKFDEIVDFSGVERYIDTPVKRYSSGMYVRLAFAVAAHLESEILIVDEVLAVGDAEFQKKCLGKMGDVSKGEGRTVLFVSHNLDSIRSLCNSGYYFKNGSLVLCSQDISNVIEVYKRDSKENQEGVVKISNPNFKFLGFSTNFKDAIMVNDHFSMLFKFKSLSYSCENLMFDFALYNSVDSLVIHSKTQNICTPFSIGEKSELLIEYSVENPNLSPGSYQLTIYAYDNNTHIPILWIDRIPILEVTETNPYLSSSLYSKLLDVRSVTYPKYKIEKL